MTETEFQKRVAATKMKETGKTCLAAKMVLVGGITGKEAANRTGIHPSVVARGVERLLLVQVKPIVCPACGAEF